MSKEPEDLSALVRRLNESVRTGESHTDSARGALGGQHARSGEAPVDAGAFPIGVSLDDLLTEAVARGASDLLLVAGVPPVVRVNGALARTDGEPLTSAATRAYPLYLLDEAAYREFLRGKASDFTFERPGLGRFRCDLHFQRGTVALSIRVLPSEVPTLQELNLPATYARFAELSRGLVLFCGPTGCGKSTTMAALVGLISTTRAAHVVAIEDPVEYVHPQARSVVEQIEVGRDSPSFAAALRHALRQNPDVILVGEMRDLETIAIALTAAETGHLVYSTLHTPDVAQTVDRIVDSFPDSQQNQIRQQLSLSLAGIAVQVLLPSSNGPRRLPACEILFANDPIRNLIRTGKNHQIHSQLTMGRKEGMLTMEESLASLVRAGRVSREEAILRAAHTDEFLAHLG